MRALPSLVAALMLIVAILPASATTILVPSVQPTIQAGINAAGSGDTVLVACGTYPEHDISMAQGVTLRSVSGDPACVTIDAQALGRVISCDALDASTRIEGITLTGGDGVNGAGIHLLNSSVHLTDCIITDHHNAAFGAGLNCDGDSSPIVSNCVFLDNTSTSDGGGVYSGDTSSPTFSDCAFYGNFATHSGGGMRCDDTSMPVLLRCVFIGNAADFGGGLITYNLSSPTVTSCTFSANSADFGGGVYTGSTSAPAFQNTIIAFSTSGEAIYSEPNSYPTLSCCDLHDNAGGDYVGNVAGMAGTDGNFSADPLFCHAAMNDATLATGSPCLAAPGCGLVGALPWGCLVDLESVSWGAIKARYR